MSKLISNSCTTPSKCSTCTIGYIIKNYVKPLMQTLTNDIKEYYMRLLVTKCLNSSVMVSVFMLGRKKGVEVADYCDTEMTRQRHLEGKETNSSILESFRDDIFNKRIKTRYLYYILLTDGKFTYNNANKEPQNFPGHVFLLEKVPGTKTETSYFNFYQSYINEYDLKEHVKKNNNTLKISYDKARSIFESLVYILNVDIWDETCVKMWKSFTFADTTNLIGSRSKDNVFLCIKKSKINNCLKYIKEYTKDKLKYLDKIPKQDINKIYGDQTLYDENQQPLSNIEMRTKLTHLYNDISKKI